MFNCLIWNTHTALELQVVLEWVSELGTTTKACPVSQRWLSRSVLDSEAVVLGSEAAALGSEAAVQGSSAGWAAAQGSEAAALGSI